MWKKNKEGQNKDIFRQGKKKNYTLSLRDLSQSKDGHRLKVKGWKIILQTNDSQKKVCVTILILDKIVFKPKRLPFHSDG